MTSTRLESRLNLLLSVVGVLLVIVVAAAVVVPLWINSQLPVVSTVEIDNMQIVGPTALCPGEPLVLEYDFHAKGAGVLVRDFTLWLTTPPKTMVYSTSRRFILDGPTDQHLRETWTIPNDYFNYETELQEPIPPGQYKRYMAISSPSRSTAISIGEVAFEIKQSCPS